MKRTPGTIRRGTVAGATARRLVVTKISSGKIVGIILLAFGCIACYSHKRVAPESAIADQAISIWTDSLIAARGPFASAPPDSIANPVQADGSSFWEGGVFVLPGTDPSVLTQNGFLDVERKPGSVMHDYYEARWSVDLQMEQLPLEIRQVRYHQKPLEYPRPWPDVVSEAQVVKLKGHVGVELLTVLGATRVLLESMGVILAEEATNEGCISSVKAWWPLNLALDKAPPEFIEIREWRIDRPTYPPPLKSK